MYDGEVNAKKLDNRVRQLDVYCNVQKIKDEATKIRLASTKMQNGTQQVGKIFPSWHDFISSLRKEFYPLGYKEKDLIEWKSLKLRK